jgi:hypothetical protein
LGEVQLAQQALLASLIRAVLAGAVDLCLAVHRAAARSQLGIVIVMRWMHPTLGGFAAMGNDAIRG